MGTDFQAFLDQKVYELPLEKIKEALLKKIAVQQEIPTYHDKFTMKGLRELSKMVREKTISDQLPEKESGRKTKDLINAVFDFSRQMESNRYVTHSSRFLGIAQTQAHSRPGELSSQGINGSLQWRGLPLVKSVYDFALIPLILSELKPRTIIEIGSGSGASALWMSDLLKINGVVGQVFSIDTRKIEHEHEGITFLQGNAEQISDWFPDDLLTQAEHPWLIIDDAHTTFYSVMSILDKMTRPGDYVILEDSQNQQKALAKFLMQRNHAYLVDTYYVDFFGRNATSAKKFHFSQGIVPCINSRISELYQYLKGS
jgi:cephalosporin hydroxylase